MTCPMLDRVPLALAPTSMRCPPARRTPARRAWTLGALVTCLAVMCLAMACATPTPPASQAPPTPPAPQAEATRVPGALTRPRLVMLVVFDQLRADHLRRFEPRLLPPTQDDSAPGGFSWLMRLGAWYPYAYHQVSPAMTCPGHANIGTGAWPYRHGITLNTWSGPQGSTYCVADPDSPLIDPDGPRKDNRGVSPRNLIGGTLGDTLKNAGYPGRVAAVSLKDRGAILLGGRRADAAIWYDDKANRWITSQHYAPDGALPPWVGALNNRLATHDGATLSFPLVDEPTGLSEPLAEGADWKVAVGTSDIGQTPYGNTITVDAALAAVDALEMGKDDHTDLLLVSFSALDKLGHEVGPNARLFEELLVDSDRALARLLDGVRQRLPDGLARVTIAVTGDHGVSPAPEYLTAHQIPSVSIDDKAMRKALEGALVARFGALAKNGEYINDFKYMHVYLNPAALTERRLEASVVRRAVADFLTAQPGLLGAYTQDDLRQRTLPPGLSERQILNSAYPGRVGDVVGILAPYHMAGTATTNHYTGYAYDRTVPLLLGGYGIRPGLRAEHAEVIDIATTLAFLIGTVPPPMAEGRVLAESLDMESMR